MPLNLDFIVGETVTKQRLDPLLERSRADDNLLDAYSQAVISVAELVDRYYLGMVESGKRASFASESLSKGL